MRRRSARRQGVGQGAPGARQAAGRAYCHICDALVGAYTVAGDRGFRPRAVAHGLALAHDGRLLACSGSDCLARPPGYVYYRGAWVKPDPPPIERPAADRPPGSDDLRTLVKTLEPRLSAGELADARTLARSIGSLRGLVAERVGVVGALLAADAVLEDAIQWALRREPRGADSA